MCVAPSEGFYRVLHRRAPPQTESQVFTVNDFAAYRQEAGLPGTSSPKKNAGSNVFAALDQILGPGNVLYAGLENSFLNVQNQKLNAQRAALGGGVFNVESGSPLRSGINVTSPGGTQAAVPASFSNLEEKLTKNLASLEQKIDELTKQFRRCAPVRQPRKSEEKWTPMETEPQ